MEYIINKQIKFLKHVTDNTWEKLSFLNDSGTRVLLGRLEITSDNSFEFRTESDGDIGTVSAGDKLVIELPSTNIDLEVKGLVAQELNIFTNLN